MKFFGGSTVGRIFGFVLILLLVLANAFVSYRSVRRVALNNQRVLKTTHTLAQLQDILATIQDAEAGQRGYIITGQESYLVPYSLARLTVEQQQKELRDLIDEPDILRKLQPLRGQIEARLLSLEQTVELRRTRGLDAARERIESGEGTRKMYSIRRTLEKLDSSERDLLKQNEAAAQESVVAGQLAFLVALGLNILFIGGFYLLSRREERRRDVAAAQLKTSNDRFSSIVSASSNIIWTTNAAGEFAEEQPSWEAFTGQNRQEYRELGWVQAVHPDDRARVKQIWDEARAQGQLYSVEYRTLRHDGQWRIMSVRGAPMRGKRGEIYEWVGTSTDVTDMQRTQRELARSDERLQLVMSNAPMILFTVDKAGVFTLSRGKALESLGLEQDEVVGQSLFDIYAPFPDVMSDVRDALEGRSESKTATYALGPVTLEGRLSVLRDEAGEISGAIGMTTDVTARYRAEKERAQLSRYNQLLLDSTGEGIFGIDLDGRCTFVNAAGAAMIGVSPDDVAALIIGRDVHELLFPQRADGAAYARADGLIARCYLSGQSLNSEDENVWRQNGSHFAARVGVYPIRDTKNASGDFVTGGVLTFEDISEKKRAEAELRDSQQQFANLANSMPQLAWTAHPDGQVYWFNQRWYDFTGTDADTMWESEKEIVHPDYLDEMRASWMAAISEERLWEHTFPLRSAEGEYRWFLSRAEPEFGADGEVVRWFGTNTDVTQSREIAAHLEASESRKAAILETALDCIIAIDEESHITEWNPAAEKAFGHSRAEALGQILPDLIIPPALRDAHLQGMAHYLETGEGPVLGQRIEVPALHADGHEFPIELAITRIEGAGPPLFTAYLRDISERKRAEAELARGTRLAVLRAQVGLALNRSDDLNEMLQSCCQALVDHLDASFARVWTLDEMQNMLHLRASAGVSTLFDDAHIAVPVGQFKIGHIAQERRPHLTNDIINDPFVTDAEWARREKLVSFAGYPLLVDGQLLGVVAMFAKHALSDEILTALSTVADAIALGVGRKRSQVELERAKLRAEEASRTKSLFLANMSHELRTPLNAILGYSEMLEEEALDMELDNFTSDLGRINAAGKHLLALINDILDLSKIEAGKMDVFIEEFSLSSLIEDVTNVAAPLMEKNGNTLQLDVAGDIGLMSADQTKVRQCLFNLLSNAAKFTERGEVTLRARRESIVGLNEATAREWIVVEVQDSGIGMSAEQVLKLFQAFSQADASTTRKFGGTGLGLALTRRFCQMMGGDITVHSEPEVGSTFTINIPAQVNAEVNGEGEPFLSAEAVMHPLVETVGAALPDTCVLVIDDDPIQRDLMKRFLEKEGFIAQAASSGEQGLALAKRLKPLVITLDVMMPDMDGWHVLNELKNDPELGDIPVIMLTMVDDKSRGYALGAADYMTKPVDRSSLSNVLRKFMCDHPPCPVLLVEDDEPTRSMMKQMLEKQDWNVAEAANGIEALQRMEENRPCLILLDLMMPEMDGFEFAERVHRNENWRAIPIVVLTARDLSASERAQLNQHVHQVVQKSGQSSAELMEQVRALVAACSDAAARACDI